MEKNIIYTITGCAGSGKTEVAELLWELFGIPWIVSYTTRPIREGEVDGVDYRFITPSEFAGYNRSDMMSYTEYGGYKYFGLKSDFKWPVQSYVVTESGVREALGCDEFDVFPILITVDPAVLIERGVTAERQARDKTRESGSEISYMFELDNSGSLRSLLGSVMEFGLVTGL